MDNGHMIDINGLQSIHGTFMPKGVEENVFAKKIFDRIVFVRPNWAAP